MAISELLSFWASLFCVLAGVVFLAAYTLLARWYASPMGRMVATYAAAVTGLAAVTVVFYLIGQELTPIRYVRSGLITAIGVVLCYQTVVLVRAQTRGKKEA
jgi:drug/metabolite transporter (DMT)-like permease